MCVCRCVCVCVCDNSYVNGDEVDDGDAYNAV